MTVERERRSKLALALVALAVVTFYAMAFFPGTIGFDSAYQWWQARGGETSNIHGLGMTLLWRLSYAVTRGPAFLFMLQLGLYWCGLVLVAASLPGRRFWRIAFLLGAGLAPIPFVVFSSVVSDALMMALLCCAFGICVCALGHGRRMPFVLALALLFFAILVRKNALPAVIPLTIFACWREFGASGAKPMRFVLAGLCIGVAMQGANLLLERGVDRPVTVFAGTAVWDLAAVSIATGELLLPPSIHGPELIVADLRQAFVPYSNATIFSATHADMAQPFFDPGDPRNDEIRRAWIEAIVRHPREYLAHRWRVTGALFGEKRPEWPRELVYFPGNTQYRDNPPVASNATRLHAWLIDGFGATRASILFAAWPYVFLALIAGAVAWRRREHTHAQAAMAAIASGLLYAAPLPVIAPSAELRYLAWTCAAAVLGAALTLAAWRSPLTSAPRATTLRAPF
jgi:hypothetical protein